MVGAEVRGLRAVLWIGLSGAGGLGVAAAVGAYPTYRLAGYPGLYGMGGGVAICLVGILAGLVPLGMSWRARPSDRVRGFLASIAVRFGVVLLLTLAVVLAGWFSPTPLLLWVAIAYIMGLAGESVAMSLLAASGRTVEE